MVAAGILLCYLTGCRMVSLFDTRVKIDNHCLIAKRQADNNKDIPAARLGPEDKMLLDTDDESNYDMLGERDHCSFKNRRVDIHEQVKGRDIDCFVFSEVDDPNRFADHSGITNDKHDAGLEETGVIAWRLITFHIIPRPVSGDLIPSSPRSLCSTPKTKMGSPECKGSLS